MINRESTKEMVKAISYLKAGYTLGHADVSIMKELARIALASLEAEVIGNSVHDLFLRAKSLMYQSGGSPIEHSLNPVDAWLFEAERAAMLQANSPVIPDGYVMVPKDPTAEMLNAAWVLHGIYHASAYRTMIAAAPRTEAKR